MNTGNSTSKKDPCQLSLPMGNNTERGPSKIYRVSELTREIKRVLEDNIGLVKVEGEVSNYKKQESGHVYFTLKDESAQIDVALFQRAARKLTFELQDGQKVRVYGQVTIYEKRSRYQIIAEEVEKAGLGSLYEAFEQLKAKLKAEGLFDRPKKRLPLLPQRVGIVTSPTGAAIRDMIKVLTRRFPNIYILLAPVRVQGEGAAQEIADAIDRLNARGGLDVLIVGRGGGSLEDLWAFNEEIVARAIARSSIPVISAVGHETDFTISDFVADVRAATPSVAAEIVVQQKDALIETLQTKARALKNALDQIVLQVEKRFAVVARHYVFRKPTDLLSKYWQTLDEAQEKLKYQLSRTVEQKENRVALAGKQLTPLLKSLAERTRNELEKAVLRMRHHTSNRLGLVGQRLEHLRAQLAALNPERVLERGYSITRVRDVVVRSAAQVALDDSVDIQLARGRLSARVTDKMEP